MKKDNYWSEFEKSGNISDYLNYVACTSEHMDDAEEENNQVREGGESGFTSDCNGNSTGFNASW
ncbi:hypothetical protein [Anaerosporobacter sp.]|uniref:hypothetical protein n=1 Tax=Anaerosporobacter sp. TaxID=1872529 RepID=UPI00289CA64C|nr:hypothetical protein [Anaerosporobacter sp.]